MKHVPDEFEVNNPIVCLTCRRSEPVMHWWPELEVPGLGRMHNLAVIGNQWFMLEFPGWSGLVNPPELRLRMKRITVREDWFEEDESMSDYCRRKAREWNDLLAMARVEIPLPFEHMVE